MPTIEPTEATLSNGSTRERAAGRIVRTDRLSSILFALGDCAFLTVVSAVATMVMHHTHNLLGSFPVAMIAGMVAAMIVQMLLAFLIAPLLGSIESMVPSMVIAMVSPMSVCALHLLGLQPDGMQCAMVGAAFGVGMFILIMLYGAHCRRSLRKAYGRV